MGFIFVCISGVYNFHHLTFSNLLLCEWVRSRFRSFCARTPGAVCADGCHHGCQASKCIIIHKEPRSDVGPQDQNIRDAAAQNRLRCDIICSNCCLSNCFAKYQSQQNSKSQIRVSKIWPQFIYVGKNKCTLMVYQNLIVSILLVLFC